MQNVHFFIRILRRFPTSTLVILLAGHVMVPPGARAQEAASNPGAHQCGDYVEAYKTGQEGYGAYLKFTADVAKSRDKHESSRRYETALRGSSAASNALWLNNWCTRNPLKVYALASNSLLDELTGQGQATKPDGAPGAPQQPQVVVVPTAPHSPSSCRVGATKYCAGCSTSCTDGTKAKCMVGIDKFFDNSCLQDAICRCK